MEWSDLHMQKLGSIGTWHRGSRRKWLQPITVRFCVGEPLSGQTLDNIPDSAFAYRSRPTCHCISSS